MHTIVFIHVPKAGGKSFEKLLLQNYPDSTKVIRMYRMPNQKLDDVFAKVPRGKVGQVELIYGHIPHRIEHYIGRPCEYITMLREPIERFLSFYRYIKYDFKAHPWHSRLNSGELTLEDLISETNNNRMTKMLAGVDVNEPPTATMLDDAKHNLEAMPVFGLLERYNESCLLIANKLGWSTPFYTKTNMSSEAGRSEEPPQEAISRIADGNYLDVQLYDFAQSLFQRRVEAEGPILVEATQAYSSLYQNSAFASGEIDRSDLGQLPADLPYHVQKVRDYLNSADRGK